MRFKPGQLVVVEGLYNLTTDGDATIVREVYGAGYIVAVERTGELLMVHERIMDAKEYIDRTANGENPFARKETGSSES